MMYCLIVLYCIIEVLSWISLLYSIVQLIRKREKSIYLSKGILVIGYFLFILTTSVFIISIIQSDCFLLFIEKNTFLLIVVMIVTRIQTCVLIWIWSHWEFRIDREYVIIKNCFFKTKKIAIDDIIINQSIYYTVIPKRSRDVADDFLELSTKNSGKITVRFTLFACEGDVFGVLKKILRVWKIKSDVRKK